MWTEFNIHPNRDRIDYKEALNVPSVILITPTPSICKVEQQQGNHGEAAWEQVRSVLKNNKKKI